MAGIPQLREAAWLITGPDPDPVRHLLARLCERVDGSGLWTVELFECRGRIGEAGKAMHSYGSEDDAREALAVIYRLSRHLAPLPTWDPQHVEPGRWRVIAYEPTAQDTRRRRHDGPTPNGGVELRRR